MRTNKEQIYDFLKLHASAQDSGGVTTQYLAQTLGILRTNVSSLLNELVAEGQVIKNNGRPVLYRIKNEEDTREDECFDNLVGVDGSLRRPIQVAKAAVIYPEKSLNTLITGEQGTGKSFLAMIMYQYAIAAGVLPDNAQYREICCKDYQDDETRLLNELFGEKGQGGLFAEIGNGVLHIDNAHLLSTASRNKLCSLTEQFQHHDGEPFNRVSPMVIVACDSANKAACDDFAKNLPILIEIPPLAERPMEERRELIQRFFTLEAARAKRLLSINAELLRCLLLYECPLNILQLKQDIKRGCAMAFFREHSSKSNTLQLYMSDFEPYVRKGFLNYREHREEIERIIPEDYDYTFSGSTMQMSATDRAKLKSSNQYEKFNQRAGTLLKRGFSEEDVSILLTAEYDTWYRQYWGKISNQVVNKEQLAKLVDARTIELVETFLNEVSTQVKETFPPSVFYGLCLHVDSLTKGNSTYQTLTNQQISELVKKNEIKYSLSLLFIAKIEKAFGITLPVEEAFLITAFLCYESPEMDTTRRPVILFAMLGNGFASSLVTTINQLVKRENVFYFEVPLEPSTVETYKTLADYVKRIDRGKGLIAFYDMDFLKKFFETIEVETGIEIRAVQFPITLMGIEWARKAAITDDVNTLYQNILNTLQLNNKPMSKIIVTLCTTGEGGAQELKKYIEQHGEIHEMRVVSLATTDREQLRENLRSLQEQAVVHCIVGTVDPKLFGIPFIPISDVLSSDPCELPEILRFKNREKSQINFDEVFNYLHEQLEDVDVKKLQKMLPPIIDQINCEIMRMSIDSEIGLLMHIACSINRMNAKESIPQNLHKEQILKTNEACYKKLLKILKPLERSFNVIFTDDEMANIIMIINKL
jgi:Transcriptional antiterminator